MGESPELARAPSLAPNVAGDMGLVGAIIEMLRGIQQRRDRARVRQVAWGVGGEALGNPGEPEPITFDALYELLDAEEARIVAAWPELMPLVEKACAPAPC